MGYLEAYRERIKRNESKLFELAKNVLAVNQNIEVYMYKGTQYKKGLVFFNEEKINSICFHEVPYRWSGCGFTEFGQSHPGIEGSEMPFSVEDVLNNFQSIQSVRKNVNENFKSKEHFLKWYSFYTKFNQ